MPAPLFSKLPGQLGGQPSAEAPGLRRRPPGPCGSDQWGERIGAGPWATSEAAFMFSHSSARVGSKHRARRRGLWLWEPLLSSPGRAAPLPWRLPGPPPPPSGGKLGPARQKLLIGVLQPNHRAVILGPPPPTSEPHYFGGTSSLLGCCSWDAAGARKPTPTMHGGCP